MGGLAGTRQHRPHKEGEPMQTIRASLIALPFVGLAALVAGLSLIVGPGQ